MNRMADCKQLISDLKRAPIFIWAKELWVCVRTLFSDSCSAEMSNFPTLETERESKKFVEKLTMRCSYKNNTNIYIHMYVRMYADRRCSCQKYMGVDNFLTAGACWEYRYFLYYTHTQLVGNNKIEQEHLCRLNRFTYL